MQHLANFTRQMSSSAVKRVPFVGGNWKANGTVQSVTALCEVLNTAEVPSTVDVVVAPTALHIPFAASALNPGYQVSAQDVWATPKDGAFTGCLTPGMVADFGLKWTLTGHSERRHTVASESSEVVAAKTKAALDAGLKVVLCIGELLEDRQAGSTNEVCASQLDPVVAAVEADAWATGRIVVAYEPVWAIGTGEVASPEQAEEVHAFLRGWLSAKPSVGPEAAAALRIIYGGSVKGDNSAELYAKPNIDGFLVGGASLKADFLKIIDAVK